MKRVSDIEDLRYSIPSAVIDEAAQYKDLSVYGTVRDRDTGISYVLLYDKKKYTEAYGYHAFAAIGYDFDSLDEEDAVVKGIYYADLKKCFSSKWNEVVIPHHSDGAELECQLETISGENPYLYDFDIKYGEFFSVCLSMKAIEKIPVMDKKIRSSL